MRAVRPGPGPEEGRDQDLDGLLSRVARGDQDAFEVVYDRLAGPGEDVHLAGPGVTQVHHDRPGEAGLVRGRASAGVRVRNAGGVDAATAGAAPARAAAASPAAPAPAAPHRMDRRDGPGCGSIAAAVGSAGNPA
jgi:hypothetical protein